MSRFGHWAYAEEFSGKEAAYLIAGMDPSLNNTESDFKARPVMVKMKKSYYEAVVELSNDVDGCGTFIDEEKKEFTDINPIKNRKPQGSVLWSVEIEELVSRYNAEYVAKKIPDDYEFCLADIGSISIEELNRRRAKITYDDDFEPSDRHLRNLEFEIFWPLIDWAGSYIHEFDDQKFSRRELQRWITDNKLPSEYQFAAPSKTDKVDAPLSTRERNTLLLIIAAILEKGCKIDHADRNTAGKIAKMIEGLGAELDADTVREKLNGIPEALGRRRK